MDTQESGCSLLGEHWRLSSWWARGRVNKPPGLENSERPREAEALAVIHSGWDSIISQFSSVSDV